MDDMSAVGLVDEMVSAESARRTESCTDRLFFAEALVDKAPYRCPVCGEECAYDHAPVIPGKVMYRRTLCLCERTYCAEETERLERERIARQAAICRSGSRIEGKLRRMTFSSFRPSEGSREALDEARRLANEYPLSGRGLVLRGGAGRGKTHLAVAIGNALIGRGVSAQFWPVFDLLDEIRRTYDKPDSGPELWRGLWNTGLLILDDLGNERIPEGERGDWAREQIFRLIYRRDVNDLPVVITTNLSVDQLAGKLGQPIISRLLGACAWREIKGTDFRVSGGEW